MAFDYSGMADVADKLITDFGQQVTLRRVTHAKDGSEPWKTTDTTTDYTVYAVMEDFTSYEIDGTVIVRGDKRFLIAAKDLAIDIQPDDIIIMSTRVQWRVINSTSLDPGGTQLIWQIQARK